MRSVFLFLAVAATTLASLVGPVAILGAADDKAAATEVSKKDKGPREGVKLAEGTEGKPKWGDAVNGLRAAVVIRAEPVFPVEAEAEDLYLVVQNVSEAPIRLRDAATPPKMREVMLKVDGKPVLVIGMDKPTGADVVLKPREVAFLLVFASDAKAADGRTTGALIAEGIVKDKDQTLAVTLQVEEAKEAGEWSGKLVTGETTGAEAKVWDRAADPAPARPRP